jgi:hypothetical protein
MNTRDTELIYEAYSEAVVSQPIHSPIMENINILNAALDIIEEQMAEEEAPETSKPAAESSEALDTVQTALDIVGIDPTYGTFADIGNGVISLIRAALSKEKDQTKRHLLNAAISAVSVIPAGDLAKLLKGRKFTRPLAKGTIKVAKAMRDFRKGRAAKGAAELLGRLTDIEKNHSGGVTNKIKDPPDWAAKSEKGGTMQRYKRPKSGTI